MTTALIWLAAVGGLALAGTALFWALGGWGVVVLFVAVPSAAYLVANRRKY